MVQALWIFLAQPDILAKANTKEHAGGGWREKKRTFSQMSADLSSWDNRPRQSCHPKASSAWKVGWFAKNRNLPSACCFVIWAFVSSLKKTGSGFICQCNYLCHCTFILYRTDNVEGRKNNIVMTIFFLPICTEKNTCIRLKQKTETLKEDNQSQSY